jgi:hypothetical protein
MGLREIQQELDKELEWLKDPDVIKHNNDDPFFNLLYDLDQLYDIFEALNLKTKHFNSAISYSDGEFCISVKNPTIPGYHNLSLANKIRNMLDIPIKPGYIKLYKKVQKYCRSTSYKLIDIPRRVEIHEYNPYFLGFKFIKKDGYRINYVDDKIRYYPKNNNVFLTERERANTPILPAFRARATPRQNQPDPAPTPAFLSTPAYNAILNRTVAGTAYDQARGGSVAIDNIFGNDSVNGANAPNIPAQPEPPVNPILQQFNTLQAILAQQVEDARIRNQTTPPNIISDYF